MTSPQKVINLNNNRRGRKKLAGKRRPFFPKLSGLVIYGLLAYLIFTFSHGFYQAHHLKGEIEVLHDQLAEMKEESIQLEKELEYSQTPEAIEKMAREKLGLIKPGETVIMRAREAQP